MLKNFIAASCLLFFCNQLYAQGKTFTGFYINNDRDTLKGSFPKFKQPAINPNEIEFLPMGAQAPVKLTPVNCYKVIVQDFDEYVAYRGIRLIKPIDEGRVLRDKDDRAFANEYDSIRTFLRLIRKTSNYEILVVNDQARRNFFYKLPDKPLEELIFKKDYNESGISEVTEYKQQLRSLIKTGVEEKKLSALLKNLEYSETEIIKFLDKAELKKKTTSKNPNAGFVISAGTSVNSFKFVGDKSNYRVQTDYKTSLSPLLCFGIISPLNGNFSRHFIYPNVSLYQYKNSGEVNNDFIIRKTTFQSSLIIGPGINGGTNILNAKQLKLFISGGFNVLFLQNHKKVSETIIVSSGVTYASLEDKLPSMHYVFNLSTGLVLSNKIRGAVTYNFPFDVNYTKTDAPRPRTSNLHLSIGYKLNSKK